MTGKHYDWEKQDCIAISFYPDHEGQGGALREQLITTCKKGDHMNGRLMNMARLNAAKLGAKSFRLWIAVPRNFAIEEPDR